jgi:hypothetical protein
MHTVPSDSFLRGLKPWRTIEGRKAWRSRTGHHIYMWDSLHGEVEVFDPRGRHLGVFDPVTAAMIKGPVPGRSIDV